MSKKQLDTTAIMSELSGGSAFFPNYKKEEAPSPADEAPAKPEPRETEPKPDTRVKTQTSSASMIARKQASKPASMLASSPELIEAVRRIVGNPARGRFYLSG